MILYTVGAKELLVKSSNYIVELCYNHWKMCSASNNRVELSRTQVPWSLNSGLYNRDSRGGRSENSHHIVDVPGGGSGGVVSNQTHMM